VPLEGHEAKAIRALVNQNRKSVFYSQQLQILLESRFSHRQVAKTVIELAQNNELMEVRMALNFEESERIEDMPALYIHLRNRRYLRSVVQAAQAQLEMRRPEVTNLLGACAEEMVLRAMIASGFSIDDRSTNTYKDRRSTTNTDIDFIANRNGLAYGIEVKNRWDCTDLRAKLDVMDQLGLIPGLIVRRATPKQVQDVHKRSGFVLELGCQLYPHDLRALGEVVAFQLGLPVALATAENLNLMTAALQAQ
jgi:hypothetical protein